MILQLPQTTSSVVDQVFKCVSPWVLLTSLPRAGPLSTLALTSMAHPLLPSLLSHCPQIQVHGASVGGNITGHGFLCSREYTADTQVLAHRARNAVWCRESFDHIFGMRSLMVPISENQMNSCGSSTGHHVFVLLKLSIVNRVFSDSWRFRVLPTEAHHLSVTSVLALSGRHDDMTQIFNSGGISFF